MAAVVIKEVAGTRAIITIIIKSYMKQNCFSPIGLRHLLPFALCLLPVARSGYSYHCS